ncbi:MAG TPA: hypothetical protein VFW87_01585 [Pirellulales bacterium]|nr:hypothetical protein [Pirellulales bacterium]
MDQVKVYLGVAKKHHFWILVLITIVVAVVVWIMATNSLAKTYTANKQTIESAKQSVEKAANPGEDGLLPNRSFKEKVDTLHEGLKQQVYQAWEKLYARQAGLFHWPDMDVGREDGKLYNIGKEVKPNDKIPGFALTIFNQQYVKEEWADLFETVKIRRPKGSDEEGELNGDDEGMGRFGQPVGGRNDGPVEYEGLVVWPKDRREAIIERYFTEGTPSSLKVRLAQEDYWLFESLIGIIIDVNGDATDSRKAPIKKIEALDVAQWAIADAQDGKGALLPPSGSGDATTGAAGAPVAAAPSASTTPAMPGAAGAAGAADDAKNDDASLLAGRYIDDKGQPLATGDPDNPYAGPYAEFKQVFVHMKLIMDHRQVPALMAACGNATLPVETRELRIKMLEPQGAAGGNNAFFGGMGMGGRGMGMGGRGMGGMGMGGMGMGGMGMGGMGMFGGNQDGDVETLTYDALVELSGVIYLYNVPDLTKLGTGSSGSPANRFFGVPSSTVSVPRGGRRSGAQGSGGMYPGGTSGGTYPGGMPDPMYPGGMPDGARPGGMPAGMPMAPGSGAPGSR